MKNKNITPLSPPVVIERDKDGKPLISLQYVMIDFGVKK